MKDKKNYHIYLSIKDMDKIKLLAEKENRSLSNFMNKLIKDYLKGKDEKLV